MTRRLLFIDANTVWHRRLAEALGGHFSTVAFQPRSGIWPKLELPEAQKSETVMAPIVLPRGWGSSLAGIVQPYFGQQLMKRYGGTDTVAVLASPAWRSLARYLSGRIPYVYYCADDYRGYTGWGSDTAQAEAEMCKAAHLSVFVSESLRQRAVEEYGLPAGRTFVSPNATEPRFAEHGAQVPASLRELQRPILGVLGALSDRLDIDLIKRAAASPGVGTLLVAGPVQEALADEPWLQESRIHVTGRLPHEDMHLYALAMDAALVPYAASELNFHCSPMRLYDHLATGIPIFATGTCDQVLQCSETNVTVCDADALLDEIAKLEVSSDRVVPDDGIFWAGRAVRLAEQIRSALK